MLQQRHETFFTREFYLEPSDFSIGCKESNVLVRKIRAQLRGLFLTSRPEDIRTILKRTTLNGLNTTPQRPPYKLQPPKNEVK